MRKINYLMAIFSIAMTPATACAGSAGVLIRVNKETQRLTVTVDGVDLYKWPVSTARRGYITPNGIYYPIRLARAWYSRKYNNAPMPHSIFFHGGYAIHGSYEIREIGRPASHGCVRLSPANAKILFDLVEAEGPGKTQIEIAGPRLSNNQAEAHTTHVPLGSYRAEAQAARAPHLLHIAESRRIPVGRDVRSLAPAYPDRSPRLVDPFSELISYLQVQHP